MSKFILNALGIMLFGLFLMGFIYLVSQFLNDVLGIDLAEIIHSKQRIKGGRE